jgi:hypothetical protein
VSSQQRAQLSRGAEQMHSDCGFVQPDHRADFAWSAVAVVAQHEDCALATLKPVDSRRHAVATFACQQARFRIGLRGSVPVIWRQNASIVARHHLGHIVGGDDPTIATDARLPTVETPVDENPCEPDFERPRFAIRADVAKHLDECVLNGLIGIGRVAQVLKGDPQRAALMGGDQPFKPLARLVHFTAFDEVPNFDGKARII